MSGPVAARYAELPPLFAIRTKVHHMNIQGLVSCVTRPGGAALGVPARPVPLSKELNG